VARFLLCRKYSTSENKEKTVLRTPHHLDADPDPAFHFDADPDPSFQFDADPDLTSNFFSRLGPSRPQCYKMTL
jgi:hypothetical protein